MPSNSFMSIGEHTYGKPHVYRWSENDGKLIIGKYCSIASNVQIYLGGNHRTDWVTTYPFPAFDPSLGIEGHPATKGDVVIGNDVWLGNDCTILSGVTIGDGAVVGARAVVGSDIPPYAIATGNPISVRYRFSVMVILDLLRIKWWDWPDYKVRRFVHLLCAPDIEKFISEALKCQE